MPRVRSTDHDASATRRVELLGSQPPLRLPTTFFQQREPNGLDCYYLYKFSHLDNIIVQSFTGSSVVHSLSMNWCQRSESLVSAFSGRALKSLSLTQREQLIDALLIGNRCSSEKASAAGQACGKTLGEWLVSHPEDERLAMLELTALISTWSEYANTLVYDLEDTRSHIATEPEGNEDGCKELSIIDSLCLGSVSTIASILSNTELDTHIHSAMVNDTKQLLTAETSSLVGDRKSGDIIKADHLSISDDSVPQIDMNSSLRHDIRSPLQGALLTTELLIMDSKDNNNDDTELKEIRHSIKDAIRQLNRQ